MKNEKVVLNSENIAWKGKHGSSERSGHMALHGVNLFLTPTIYIKSHKTGKVEQFEQEWDEDGFDGEFHRFWSPEGVSFTLWNY